MENRSLRFEECEHYTDMESYMEDLTSSGAKITEHDFDPEDESCVISFSIESYEEFYDKFKDTVGFDFTYIIKPE